MTDITNPVHGISRDEWVRRFKAKIFDALGTKDEAIADAELESYPPVDERPVAGMPNDWELSLPEDAALEQLSYWEADE